MDAVGSVATNIEVVNQVRTASARDIEDLDILDAKAIQFSLLDPIQLDTWVDEHNQIIKKGIKEITSLVVQIHLHSHLLKVPEAEEIMSLSKKWESWEK